MKHVYQTAILLLLFLTGTVTSQDIESTLSGSTPSQGFTVMSSTKLSLFTVRGDGNVGIGLLTPLAPLHVNGKMLVTGVDGFLATAGTTSQGTIPKSGAGARMMWYPKKRAFRVGEVNGTQWDDANIGLASIAMGSGAIASADHAISIGVNSEATGGQAVALGNGTTASGAACTAMGASTTASGDNSIASGLGVTASGHSSVAMGNGNLASGITSTALGKSTTASGDYSFAVGNGSIANNNETTALGYQCTASGSVSTAMGYGSTASGIASTSTGVFTLASGEASFATGKSTTASGEFSCAMGNDNTASGNYSTVMGNLNTASGNNSVSTGYSSDATGYCALAVGFDAVAGGSNSISLGGGTNASGYNAVAIGFNTIASGGFSTALGKNVSTNGKAGAFIIGDKSAPTYAPVTHYATVDNGFFARFAGGYQLWTNAAANMGAQLAANGSSWSSISDSTRKEGFRSADADAILGKFRALRLGSWNYKGQDASTLRHYGPMAQEWFAAFGHDGIGTIGNSTTLASADVDGVLCIAVQALEKRTVALQQQLKDKDDEIAQLKSDKDAEITQLKSQLAAHQQTTDQRYTELVKMVRSLQQDGQTQQQRHVSLLKAEEGK